MLSSKERGQWKNYSTKEVKEIVEKLSAGLLSLGVGPNDMSIEGRDKIAIMCKNRPEWLMLDLAVQHGIVGKAGAWFDYKDGKIGQGREATKVYLKENTKVRDEIEKEVRKKVAEAEG